MVYLVQHGLAKDVSQSKGLIWMTTFGQIGTRQLQGTKRIIHIKYEGLITNNTNC